MIFEAKTRMAHDGDDSNIRNRIWQVFKDRFGIDPTKMTALERIAAEDAAFDMYTAVENKEPVPFGRRIQGEGR